MNNTSPTRESLIEHFRALTDEYLLKVYKSRTLIKLAVEIADMELTRRSIAHPSPLSVEEDNHTEEPESGEPIIFETVARFSSTSQCEILRGRLEAEGIPAFVINGGVNQLYPFTSMTMGGARLQVPQSYASQAREIIAAVNSGRLAATNDDVEK